jgi:hypothetical protein
MPVGRLPGPFGLGGYGCILHPQSLGSETRFWDSEFLPVTPGPTGSNGDLGAQAVKSKEVLAAEDDAEYQDLQNVYGILNAKGRAYGSYDKKKRKWKGLEAYLKHRDANFGSSAAYRTFKQAALDELEADKGKLRNGLEPPKEVRQRRATIWKDAQTAFYAWVRKGYKEQLGDDADVPKLVNSGQSDKLREALRKVRVSSGEKFQTGGFNPRPTKLAGKYRLGTLSDHALGTAVDVEDDSNAQIEAGTWQAILTLTGKALNHSSRKSKWKHAPKELFDAVVDVNATFVSKVAEAVADAEKAAEEAEAKAPAPKAGAAPPKAAATKVDPLDSAIAKDAHLRAVGKKFLNKWKDGFFSLDWALVKAFSDEGFTWGATFPNPDLHHFEL